MSPFNNAFEEFLERGKVHVRRKVSINVLQLQNNIHCVLLYTDYINTAIKLRKDSKMLTVDSKILTKGQDPSSIFQIVLLPWSGRITESQTSPPILGQRQEY